MWHVPDRQADVALSGSSLDALRTNISTALELADAGLVAKGYMILLQGFLQALLAAEDGLVWGGRVALGYGEALQDFTAQYGTSGL